MRRQFLPILASFALVTAMALGADTFEDAVKRAAADYDGRMAKAIDELNRARTRIGDEKAPLLKAQRAAEDRIITAQTQIKLLETAQEESASERRKVLKSLDAFRKTSSFFGSLVHDGEKAFEDGLAPGETQQVSERMDALKQKLDEKVSDVSADPGAALDLAEYLLDRTELSIGGYSTAGRAIAADGNQVMNGTFAFAGPSAFFRPEQGGAPGIVSAGSGAAFPVVTPMGDWKPDNAAAYFSGKGGTMLADVTGGKAMRLKETRGTVFTHINTGGLVAYLILGVGFLSILLIVQKILDMRHMNMDSPAAVQSFLAAVATGSRQEVGREMAKLKGATRELFEAGVKQLDGPKSLIEEHLQSVLLRQQQHYERRLPLLAVIATAAPLMGLLGTVVGMVKTFALITVFGTGNAGKLASGISQVLVATELGLIVAIPTLIAHGFLAHRIQRNLSTLERYAVDFVTAADAAKAGLEIDPVRG